MPLCLKYSVHIKLEEEKDIDPVFVDLVALYDFLESRLSFNREALMLTTRDEVKRCKGPVNDRIINMTDDCFMPRL